MEIDNSDSIRMANSTLENTPIGQKPHVTIIFKDIGSTLLFELFVWVVLSLEMGWMCLGNDPSRKYQPKLSSSEWWLEE